MGGNALAAAVDIVGGQAKLARILGVTQPNVWHWLHKSERVPGEYVLKIEEATGGTLLLDEISEMDVRLQAKLLRAIQERVIDRVGGTKPVAVDIRVIATSNRNLVEAVRAGTGREDVL